MAVVIFGDLFQFPEGGAPTNRVYTFAKGFMAHNMKVHVVCFNSDYIEKTSGSIDGIYFYYPFAQKKRSGSFLIRRWKNLLKYFNTYALIKRINKEDKILVIISYSVILFTNLYAFFLSKLFKTKLVAEVNEHPLRDHQKGSWKRMQGAAKYFIESRMSDGIFCISHFLIDFYKSKGFNSNRLLLVPSTVDPDRFVKVGQKPVSYKYVGYFGSLSFARDNVDLLIKAFARFSKLHKDIYLVLGGYCNKQERKSIMDLIAKLNIQSNVLLLEYLTREEIVQYIIHADILVMVRSNDLQSQASYPSKLTEFLASSKPVITVDVGEIRLYVKDGVNGFIVRPGDLEALIAKLDYVYKNPEIANKVGKNGKQLAETVFNYKYQAERMIGFINSN